MEIWKYKDMWKLLQNLGWSWENGTFTVLHRQPRTLHQIKADNIFLQIFVVREDTILFEETFIKKESQDYEQFKELNSSKKPIFIYLLFCNIES